jgi:transcription initiation factor TFIIIB Brf1 subunit/transcription initiation factor TFIIB
MLEPATCPHARRQLIAKDNEAEYIECLDCGAILEAAELTAAPRSQDAEADSPGVNESLSDA